MAHEPPPPSAPVQVVLPFKDLTRAKSRLLGVPAVVRGRLAQLMLLHTVSAWNQVGASVRIVSAAAGTGSLLRGHGLRATVLPDPGRGLNAAFARGAEDADEHRLLVATMADLPAISAQDLQRALGTIGAGPGRWFVRDAAGTGTSLLAARELALQPLFGTDSARRHQELGAVELDVPAPLRHDVDTLSDLTALATAGALPAAMAGLLGPDGVPFEHLTATVGEAEPDGVRLLLADGTAMSAPREVLAAEVIGWRCGQRVQVTRDREGRVRAVWL
ncbi:2-phospho-L-lactate guanylyltransferase [Enemella dayhoffiae]|uniref:2-phospho-L-lactate guanylyltransferase n=1 Tax=Enemella dayhoffiae TaxID=2016507 RepID=A0A255H347_9ACTN|nr:2-phospho-L-lactate guanylyltransferase [Enemella dayhoffiae]OYO22060.1 2-phospho-L-lactate guanylyltransferase [Enemella dayhoffiae]